MMDSVEARGGARRSDGFGPIQGVTEGASSVLNDAFDLAELQGKLVIADFKEFGQTARFAVLGLVVTLAILIASLPIVALGMAHCLAWSLEWPLWICLLVVGLTFTVGGLATGYLSVRRLLASLRSFETSQKEALENISWFRKALSRTFSI